MWPDQSVSEGMRRKRVTVNGAGFGAGLGPVPVLAGPMSWGRLDKHIIPPNVVGIISQPPPEFFPRKSVSPRLVGVKGRGGAARFRLAMRRRARDARRSKTKHTVTQT